MFHRQKDRHKNPFLEYTGIHQAQEHHEAHRQLEAPPDASLVFE